MKQQWSSSVDCRTGLDKTLQRLAFNKQRILFMLKHLFLVDKNIIASPCRLQILDVFTKAEWKCLESLKVLPTEVAFTGNVHKATLFLWKRCPAACCYTSTDISFRMVSDIGFYSRFVSLPLKVHCVTLCSVFFVYLQSLRSCQCSSSPSTPQLTTRNQSPSPASLLDLLTRWSHGTGTFHILTHRSERFWTREYQDLMMRGGERVAIDRSGPKIDFYWWFYPRTMSDNLLLWQRLGKFPTELWCPVGGIWSR